MGSKYLISWILYQVPTNLLPIKKGIKKYKICSKTRIETNLTMWTLYTSKYNITLWKVQLFEINLKYLIRSTYIKYLNY